MRTLDFIGLDATGAKKTVEELQQLLADMHIFYMNMRGFHWNVEGNKFFSLHKLFEEIYDGLSEQIDEVAERILTLGGNPESKFSAYLNRSTIKEAELIKDTKGTIQATLDGFKLLIAQMRKVVEVAENGEDQVTEDMMIGFIEGYEKRIWMLVAFMK